MKNVRTFLHVGDMWVTVYVPLHKLLSSGHDNLEENKEAHSIFSDDFLCMHYLIRLSKHLARKIYESKNLENTASKSWKKTNDPYGGQTMSAISEIWKIMDGYTFYPTYINISFLAAVYKKWETAGIRHILLVRPLFNWCLIATIVMGKCAETRNFWTFCKNGTP